MFEPELETLEIEKLKSLQAEKVRRQIRYAYENIPFYKKKFDEKGLDPDDINSVEDVEKIPFTVKDDLRDHYPYGILAVSMDRILEFHSSSGTTGVPTVVSYTAKDVKVWSRLMARTFAAAGAKAGDIAQNAYGYGLFTGGMGFHYGALELGCAVLPIASGNTRRQLKMMKDLKITILCATPSYAMFLSEAAKEEGYNPSKDFNLKVALCGAEPWSEEMRKKIQERLGVKAYDCYGLSEIYGPGVAVECEQQHGLHIWADEFYAEVIDPETGEVRQSGKSGELVLTMLNREAMPLLRYRTGDICEVNWDKCQCGRTHPRIMRVTGRSDDMLIVRGMNIFPSQIEDILFGIPGIGSEYQIVVDRDILDFLMIKVELAEDFSGDRDALKNEAVKSLAAWVGVKAMVELLDYNTLPRAEGKAKRVVDLREK
ncbi:phenylacetate--CoA ligase family protein [Acidobacteriota bacterium]